MKETAAFVAVIQKKKKKMQLYAYRNCIRDTGIALSSHLLTLEICCLQYFDLISEKEHNGLISTNKSWTVLHHQSIHAYDIVKHKIWRKKWRNKPTAEGRFQWKKIQRRDEYSMTLDWWHSLWAGNLIYHTWKDFIIVLLISGCPSNTILLCLAKAKHTKWYLDSELSSLGALCVVNESSRRKRLISVRGKAGWAEMSLILHVINQVLLCPVFYSVLSYFCPWFVRICLADIKIKFRNIRNK